MNEIKKLSLFLYFFFIFISIFYYLDLFQFLEIKNQSFKKLIFFSIFPLCIFSFIFILSVLNNIKQKIIFSIYPFITLFFIFNFGIIKTLFFSSAWHTQTILYQNKYDESRKVEYQMIDGGFSGYETRIVEINYFTNWFYTSKKVSKHYNSEWKKINKEVNELKVIY